MEYYKNLIRELEEDKYELKSKLEKAEKVIAKEVEYNTGWEERLDEALKETEFERVKNTALEQENKELQAQVQALRGALEREGSE
jgi:small-conductance mechanosensitive channel